MSKDKFNQQKYVNDYNRKNYKNFNVRIRVELEEEISQYIEKNNIKSKSEFLKLALESLQKNKATN